PSPWPELRRLQKWSAGMRDARWGREDEAIGRRWVAWGGELGFWRCARRDRMRRQQGREEEEAVLTWLWQSLPIAHGSIDRGDLPPMGSGYIVDIGTGSANAAWS